MLKSAVDTARAALPDDDDPVLNIFVAPEFYWHGQMGPYLYAPGEPDPAEVIRAELERLFPLEEYPDFLFVFGSALSAEVGDIDVVLSSSSATVLKVVMIGVIPVCFLLLGIDEVLRRRKMV